ncbi:rhodanese-like domain-containing protein [Rhodovulum sp. DZ06]|uniref:rhodanese-like domain-containing protein n=1 Tax=Rhodovulum sp. DZ06 TaxID=3425126 RepID=UPI003D32516F
MTAPKKTLTEMLAEAEAAVETLTVEEAQPLLGVDGITFVDIRDVRELQRDGIVPGAYHAPRGMLEFWIAEDSPYTKDVFQTGNKFVFFCAGGLRSALAAQVAQTLGLEVAHVEGGYGAWKKAGAPTAPKPEKKG